MKSVQRTSKTGKIVLLVLATICLITNCLFFLVYKEIIPNNKSLIDILHFLLPLCYLIIALFILFYTQQLLERFLEKVFNKKRDTVFGILFVAYVFTGVFLLLLLISHPDIGNEERIFSRYLSNTLYFQCIRSYSDYDSIGRYWGMMPLFCCFGSSIIAFVGCSRVEKKRKAAIDEKDKRMEQEAINSYLGFDYQSCDYYTQTKIPYQKLCKDDGTWGEFEAYRVLREVEDAKCLFNREVPKENGLCTELDLIVVHQKGIIVIENKYYTTRVYGRATDHDLTIINRKGQKQSIYNPVIQNENHVRALKNYLQTRGLYENDCVTPISSIVVFTVGTNDKTDDFISGIDTEGTSTIICTSQNLAHTVERLLDKSSCAHINSESVYDIISKLPMIDKNSH